MKLGASINTENTSLFVDLFLIFFRRFVQTLDDILSQLTVSSQQPADPPVVVRGSRQSGCMTGGCNGSSCGPSREPLVPGFTRDPTVSVIVR